MTFPLAKNWWSIAARGALAVLFGVFTALMPGLTLSTLLPFFGAYALLEGGFNLVGAYRAGRDGERWPALLLEGALGVLCGLVALAQPEMGLAGFIYLLAFWAVATGGLDVVAGLRLHRRLHGEWLLALSGAASVGFGLLLLAAPRALTIAYWLGAYSLLLGTLLMAVGMRLRAFTDDNERASLKQPIEEI
jgi:uncharacterized membrane protein HdeD (DUF308 family)